MEKKERDRLYNWSVKHDGDCRYPKADKDVKTYFIQHKEHRYLEEYGFEAITDLTAKLEGMWCGSSYMEEILKTVAVATMKNEPGSVEKRARVDGLSDHIYIF